MTMVWTLVGILTSHTNDPTSLSFDGLVYNNEDIDRS